VTQTRAVEAWTLEPLERFVAEAGARITLLMTPAGQVLAQHGFTRAVDVMSAAALGAAIVASSGELASMLDQRHFSTLDHQGVEQGLFLGAFDITRGRLLALVVYGPQAVLAADFEREVNESLATLFGQ
jgi:hypothetical protein